MTNCSTVLFAGTFSVYFGTGGKLERREQEIAEEPCLSAQKLVYGFANANHDTLVPSAGVVGITADTAPTIFGITKALQFFFASLPSQQTVMDRLGPMYTSVLLTRST
jgi:hypothetical protein